MLHDNPFDRALGSKDLVPLIADATAIAKAENRNVFILALGNSFEMSDDPPVGYVWYLAISPDRAPAQMRNAPPLDQDLAFERREDRQVILIQKPGRTLHTDSDE